MDEQTRGEADAAGEEKQPDAAPDATAAGELAVHFPDVDLEVGVPGIEIADSGDCDQRIQ